MRVRIITLNVRRDEQDDGINNWQYRRDLIAAIMRRYDPDIAAFQEVLVHQLRDLQEMLAGYGYIGVGRDDGREAGEFAPIFHRDLAVSRQGTFWLSDTPERPSRIWPGMTRICTWATFSGGYPFAVFNAGRVKIADCRVLTDNPSTQRGVYPSDHWPVLCDVDLG